MAPPQKRKLDSTGTDAPGEHKTNTYFYSSNVTSNRLTAMSAFAARQRLWPTTATSEPQSPSSPAARLVLEPSPKPDEEPAVKPPSPARQDPEKPRTKVQFSTFRPDKKNYQQKADGRVLVRVAEGERLVILGSYGIRVCEGELTIAGAVLRSTAPLQWVHATHCHALPVIRAVADLVMELRPHPAAPELRQLAGLSPVFAKLWNEPGSGGSTFQIVCISAT